MERIRKYTYKVNQQEKVIFTIHPLNGATKKVTAAQNGKTLQDVGGAKNRFEFKCDESPGNTHFVKIECSFLQGDPEEAEFEMILSSGGGEKFQDFPNIKKKQDVRTQLSVQGSGGVLVSMKRPRLRPLCFLTIWGLVLFFPILVWCNEYPNHLHTIDDEIEKGLNTFLGEEIDSLESYWKTMVFYTVADAVVPLGAMISCNQENGVCNGKT